jgi:hypothetical protein
MLVNIEIISMDRGHIMLIYKNFKFIQAYTFKNGINRLRFYYEQLLKCLQQIIRSKMRYR